MAAPLCFVDGLGSLFRCPCALGRRWSQRPAATAAFWAASRAFWAASSARLASTSARSCAFLAFSAWASACLPVRGLYSRFATAVLAGLPSMLVRVVFAGGIPRCWNATKSRTLTHRVLPLSATRASGDDAFTCSTVDDPRSIVRATRPSVPMLQPSASSAFTICLISLFIGSFSPSRRGRCLSLALASLCG